MLLTKGSNTYTNDADGNTLTGGGRTNTWDSQNQLTTCVNGTNTSVFTYGADGLRHRSTVGVGQNALTTDYALDGQSVVQELRTLSGVQTPIATYLTGPSGPMYKRQDGQGIIRWYVYDGLGSVVGEVDPNGVMTARRGFDVYGATRSSSGTPTSQHGFVGGLGHPTEDETGLVYMRARYYDASVGRFVSEDPARDGGNWYIYVNDAPTTQIDINGRSATVAVWLTVLAAGLVAYSYTLMDKAKAYQRSAAEHVLLAEAALKASMSAFGNFPNGPGGIVLGVEFENVAGLEAYAAERDAASAVRCVAAAYTLRIVAALIECLAVDEA